MQDGTSSTDTQQAKLQQQQGDQHHQASAMDDFLDNIISIPSWSEATALKAHWDCSNPAAAATAASSGDFAVDSTPSKLLKSPSFSEQQQQQQQQFSSISSMQQLQDIAALSNVLGSRGSLPPPIELPTRSLSEGSEHPELAAAAAWCQQYQQLDLHHQSNQSGRLVSSERAPAVFGNNAQTRVSGQQQTAAINPSTTSAGVLKPRVRARRGQATDPHSIAERLRRERIADRMKALQELVPNANKTDKASMLDEIIEYVKFLQLQVKVLSMSRLGAASFMSPLIADLPPSSSEAIQATSGTSTPEAGGFCLSERQVARLMEEDMGSAMQYLQSKGLCLMPITLASAISSPSSRGSSSMTTTPTAAAGSSPQQQQQQSESSK